MPGAWQPGKRMGDRRTSVRRYQLKNHGTTQLRLRTNISPRRTSLINSRRRWRELYILQDDICVTPETQPQSIKGLLRLTRVLSPNFAHSNALLTLCLLT